MVIEIGGLERLPDVFYRHFARVYHVGAVEAVVAQVIEHDLVGGEIVAIVAVTRHHLLDGHPQRRLTQGVDIQSVGDVTDGAHREDDVHVGIERVQGGEHLV